MTALNLLELECFSFLLFLWNITHYPVRHAALALGDAAPGAHRLRGGGHPQWLVSPFDYAIREVVTCENGT